METCRHLSFQRVSLLGAQVDLVTPDLVLEVVASSAMARNRTVIANHNLHSLHLFARRADMRAFYGAAEVIEIDSTPMIAWGRLMGLPLSGANRSTYLDFRDDFWALVTARGLRVCHVGGAPGVGEAARAALLERWPSVHLDVLSGYFSLEGAENDAVIAQVQAMRPDVLLVGMGMPRQELWVLNNLERLPDCPILTIGGAFDYEAGVQYLPPRWTGRLGVEWLARFAANPSRLFTRYFVEPWSLIPQFIADVAWTLSGQDRSVARTEPAETAMPWLRRQALSTLVQQPEAEIAAAPVAEPADETAAEPRRAAG